jgi:poly-gamma-glutamate synthesis protein (capsule biosynthesis protein)
VELYRGRPIFYGLGNFLFSDIQEPVTKILYEEARDLLVEVFEDPSLATDADVNRLLNAHGFDDQRYFESVVVEVEYAGGHTVSIRLHPIELGKGRRLTESGIPRRAEHEAATSILKRLVRASEPFGTSIDITDGTGVITP